MFPTAKVVLPIVIVIIGFAAALQITSYTPQAAAVPNSTTRTADVFTVEVLNVALQEVRIPIRSQGRIIPRTTIDLSAEISGKVTEIDPDFAAGGRFKKNDTLVKIDDRDYKLAIVKAEAIIASARARLTKADAEYQQKQKEYYAQGLEDVPPYALRKPQYDEALANMKAAEADLELAKLALERTRVTAPFDGRVVETTTDVGRYVTRGTALGKIYAMDVVEVYLPVSQRQAHMLELPQGTSLDQSPLRVSLTEIFSGKGHTWSARVVRTSATVSENNQLLYLIAQVDTPYFSQDTNDGQQSLTIGTFVTAELQSKPLTDIVVLPRQALGENKFVWVVDDHSTLRKRQVEIAYLGKHNAYINGLAPGTRVVVSTLEGVLEGITIRITRTHEPTTATESLAKPAAKPSTL